ncbi:Reverse transcriptase domain [Arabidopsis thaliana x Arabidopsis arenosa]|uniref:Reverse transcriptase domain n=1 Tax=Arabidopsis thaliana x Arabidopsis arenosa TaxID=1240361 RepID=A0A8T1YDM6_9BRAS|nr:Reverse transcriptase domain [Arabidopsis thaliana x Arabidopsis arenosa]
MLCITTASFSVQVNGELAGFFQSSRGLRQGCSLSPYLFVMSMDVLSKMLDQAADLRKYGYHPRCKSIGLTHLSFADDLMVLSDGKVRSIDGIVEVFDAFAKRSGLKISMEKSTIYLAGLSDSTYQEIQERYQFDVGHLPVRYLGLPLVTKRLTSSDYMPLIERIKQKIGTWTSRFLSYAGRLNLIQSVIWSICNFWLAAFRLPRECIGEIDKICSAFLWSGPELNSHKAKIAWTTVCKPKQEGGLGLRSLKEANEVCCLKLIWRLVSHANSLWVRWINKYLLKKDTFWSIKETTSLGSWMWKKLIKYRGVAKKFCKVEVNDGKSTSFWYDQWSTMGCLRDVVGVRGTIDLGIRQHMTVAEAWSGRRQKQHRTDILNRIEAELLLKRQNQVDKEDRVLWKGKHDTYKAKFTTKDTWNHIRLTTTKVAWHNSVWFAHATPKYSFCAWLAMQNKLSTGDRMAHWNRGTQTSCVFCSHNIETRNHLFFSCPFSAEIWYALAKNIYKAKFSTNWSDLITSINGQWSDRLESFIARYVFHATLHTIWRERNRRRHGENPNPPARLINWIDKQVRNQLSTIRTSGDRRYDKGLQAWFQART